MRRPTTVLLSLAAVVLVAACGIDGGDPTGESTTSVSPTAQEPTTDPPTTDAPGDDPTDVVPPFPDNTAPQVAKPSGEGGLVFTDVRVADHSGFDRIVLVFTGTGIPGWAVSYVDAAVVDGSGETVRLGGDATLDIHASNTTWPADGYYSGPPRLDPANGGSIAEVYVVGTVEGSTQVLAGIEGAPAPFRVFALTDPSRLVVDVLDNSID